MKIDVKDILKIELTKNDILVIEVSDPIPEADFKRLQQQIEKEFKRRGFEKPLIMISELDAKFTKIRKASE